MQHERLGQRFQQSQPEFIHVDLIGDVFSEYDELVTTEPCNRVGVPDRLSEPAGHYLEHLIAGNVAERVIDVLEPVEVHEQQRDGAIMATCDRKCMIQPFEECGSVVQTRQRIETGESADVRLDELLLGNVEPDTPISQECAVLGRTGSPLIET